MKALALEGPVEFRYRDFDDPVPGTGEVRIAVRACGICGSDVHGMDGSTGRRVPPIIMGHEAAGIIESVGPGVADYNVGDRVTFDSTVYCGECRFCLEGRINLCDNRMVLGVSCAEYRRHGAFADYVVVPERILYRLPGDVSFEQASMVEALSIAVHAAGRAPIGLGDTAAVVGAGMIGLLVVQTLRNTGCSRIVAVDIDKQKLLAARELGADIVVDASDCDAAARVRELTGGGADLAYEVVGATPSIKTAVGSLRKGGALVMVGNLSPEVALPLQEAVTRELTLFGSCASSGEYPACLDLIARRKVNVDALISAAAPLSEGAAWFGRLYNKEPGLMKVILRPDE